MRLHLGSGPVHFVGWYNLDLGQGHDLREGLPDWADESVEAVYSFHLLEHLSYTDGQRLLGEVYRVLVPGGVVRLGVPDFALFTRAYASGDGEFGARYFARYCSGELEGRLKGLPVRPERSEAESKDAVPSASTSGPPGPSAAAALSTGLSANGFSAGPPAPDPASPAPGSPRWFAGCGRLGALLQIVYGWEHRAIYDEGVLRWVLEQAGFPPASIHRCAFGESRYFGRCALDQHFEDHTLLVEARKPPHAGAP